MRTAADLCGALIACFAGLLASVGAALAQAYPVRPILFVREQYERYDKLVTALGIRQ